MKLSDGEKLILVMLCDIYEKLGIKGEIDARFVKSAINNGNLWGLSWRYPGVFDTGDRDPETVREVGNILEMWWFMESAYEKLSKEDKERISKDADPLGNDVKFRGFDGNNEGDHYSIAHFLIHDLDRFSGFENRDLNSHYPSIGGYRRMLEVFEPMYRSLGHGRGLNAEDIIKLLNAQIHPESPLAESRKKK